MQDRKQQILDATVELFHSEGLKGVTMRKVAKTVGVSATALYRHYENKDQLMASVVEAGQHLFASYLFRSLSAPTPEERLIKTGELYIDFAFEQPNYFRITFMAWDELDADRHTVEKYQGASPTFQFLIDRIAECLPSDRGSNEALLLETAMTLWALVHGLASLYLGAGLSNQMSPTEYRALCRSALERTVAGLLA